MANLKNRRHSTICNDCSGNGYVTNKSKELIIQCKTCDSEGEIYVYESEIIQSYTDADTVADNVIKLH